MEEYTFWEAWEEDRVDSPLCAFWGYIFSLAHIVGTR
jgi:hypothetical protein